MATPGKKMKPLDDEVARLDAEIARLRGERDGLLRAKALLSGGEPDAPSIPRKRSVSIKPLVLDVMARSGATGATSAEVNAIVRAQIPTVAKDTVGSILSRLKGDGALVYVGERYYEKRYAPNGQLRVI